MNDDITTTRTPTSLEKSCQTILGGATVRIAKGKKTAYVVSLYLPAGEDIAPSAFRTNDKAEALEQFNTWVRRHLVARIERARKLGDAA